MLKYLWLLAPVLAVACVTTIRTDLTRPQTPKVVPHGEGEGEGEGELGIVTPPVVLVDAGGTEGLDSGTLPEGPSPEGDRSGLWIEEGELRNASGKVILKGVNHTLFWGWYEHNEAAIPEIAKTGANAIRLVYSSHHGHKSVPELARTIQAALDAGLIPVIENHDATCKQARADLEAVVAWWLEPTRVAALQTFGDRIILNIANEWGSFNSSEWRDAYVDALVRLRAAGITAPVMVDAGGACGQNPRSVRDYGRAVLAADPLDNVMFSVHMYAYWRTAEATDVGRWNDSGTGSPWRIRDELAALKALGLAIVVGEIGWQGSPQVGYLTDQALDDLQALGIGWLAWSWTQNSDSALDLLRFSDPALYLYRPEDLSDGGRVFVQRF